ncbi:MAG: hypothetical protein RLZZ15_2335 [Verrucomicrobiota bacterium]|jgi:hypothetical protein
MSLLDKLERTLGRFAVPNVALYLVIGQVAVLLTHMLGHLDLNVCVLVPDAVKEGEWWRLLTFCFLPPPPGMFGYLLVAFSLYLFYLMGNALEDFWGVFRFNLFLLTGYALTVGVAFFTPSIPVTNLFIGGSVFLAFAYLNPDFEMLLFFILPVKIKWLALVSWLLTAYWLFVGDLSSRLQILASVGNFLIFFSGDILRSLRHGRQKMVRQARDFAEAGEPRHRCHACGKTDLTHPQLDFRYCSKCAGDECYCPEHIQNHAHSVAPDEPAKR